jgi:hypothetical protein
MPDLLPRPTRGIILGVIGRSPAQGMTAAVLTFGKCRRVQRTSGSIRSARISRLSPLNSAVPATRNRSRPSRLVTSFAASSRRLTVGAADWLTGFPPDTSVNVDVKPRDFGPYAPPQGTGGISGMSREASYAPPVCSTCRPRFRVSSCRAVGPFGMPASGMSRP